MKFFNVFAFSMLAASSLAEAVDAKYGHVAAALSAQSYAKGDLPGATRILKAAVINERQNAQLHFMLGNALFRQKDFLGAVEHYRRAIALRPMHPDSQLNLGFAYFNAGFFGEAVSAWTTAVDQSPSDALMHFSLALGLDAQGKSEDAHKHVLLATGLDEKWENRLAIDVRWTQEMIHKIRGLTERAEHKHREDTRAGVNPIRGSKK